MIRGARVHNLKNIDVEIPKNKLTVITGLSGSGKSSLAFDTIYAEGQRRFIESLSPSARHFLELQDKPDIDEIRGLTPTIALEQRQVFENPRSTVGTVTEINDYLRLLFARAGNVHCLQCDTILIKRTAEDIVRAITAMVAKETVTLFSPLSGSQDLGPDLLKRLAKAGFERVRVNGAILPISHLQEAGNLDTKRTLEIQIGILSPHDLAEDPPHVRQVILTALDLGDGTISVIAHDGKEHIFSKALVCPNCGTRSAPLEPQDLSFNSPRGACGACDGLGSRLIIEPELLIPNPRLTLAEGAIRPWVRINTNQSFHLELLQAVGKRHGFDVQTPLEQFSKKSMHALLDGTGEESYTVGAHSSKFAGVVPELVRRHRETDSDFIRKEIEGAMRKVICPDCEGKRLNKKALSVTLGKYTIADVCARPLPEARQFIEDLLGKRLLTTDEGRAIGRPIIREMLTRVNNIIDAGLEYLTLGRSSPTLSGGEGERLRLAVQLGTPLSGVIYVLDEPTVGLHERDTEKLIVMLERLKNAGNSVIVVEHDAQVIKSAEWLIDMGPGAGEDGGKIVAQGTPEALMKKGKGLTAEYLNGKRTIEVKKPNRKSNGHYLEITEASEFNLKNVSVKIPLGLFIGVTGVSGSGKSTLVLEILAKALSHKLYGSKELPGAHKTIRGMEHVDKVITVDQSPIGKTPRSNPATYTGIFTTIRDLFTEVEEARLKGFDAGSFSFNVKGGRCETCAGEGYIRIPMQFLPETYVECSECKGTRYRRDILEILYRGKNIAEVLAMSIKEAATFWADVPLLAEKLNVLEEVGLGYMKLGQGAPTLSGGEAQRVKLAAELGRRATGKTIYILDEPTTGLHFEDIRHLLTVLHHLVDKGNTVLVIEHNLDVIRTADWIIDLGPEGGDKGGMIVAQGTPLDIAQSKKSFTGQYLKKFMAE